MTVIGIAPFSVVCPTQIEFGVGASTSLAGYLPEAKDPIVFVQGASGSQSAGILDDLRQSGREVHVVRQSTEPSIDTIHAALDQLRGREVAAVVACGGGSVIDAGKTIAFLLDSGERLSADFSKIAPACLQQRHHVRSIAIPTTAGTGAEVTANAVIAIPSKSAKISLRGKALFPDLAIIDPALMMTAPSTVAIQSGLDAITQVVESYTSSAATPFSDAMSGSAISTGLKSLKCIVDHPTIDAWSQMAWVSLSSGFALANSGLGAAHGIASVIGGQYEAPHGALCGRLLVPVLRANLRNAGRGSRASDRLTDCMDQVAQVFGPRGGQDILSGFDHWIEQNAVPRLRNWGVKSDDIESLAEQSVGASSSKKNAVPLNANAFAEILKEAF